MRILESELNGQKFIVKSFPLDNQRKLMKFKIFLNSNKLLEYLIDESNLKIHFMINDVVLIGKEIKKIVSFIQSTFDVQLNLDNNTQKSLDNNARLISKLKNSYKILSELKSNGIQNNPEYIDFCNLSDRTLSCKLRPYQYEASFFLTIGQGGFDFSVPGSGKTIISYSTYNYLRVKSICNSILIIGPINSFNAWQDEYETCFNCKPDFISLANCSKNEAIAYLLSSKQNHHEITFVNVDKAWRIQSEIIKFLKGKKTLLIIDEAHKEKNPNAEITKAVLEITKHVEYRIILTGTPMPNGYEDLYSLMKIYEPYEKILPFNYSDLKKLTKYGADIIQQTKIMDSIRPIYSRVSKAYLLKTGELLPPNCVFVDCKLSNEQNELYEFLQKMAYEIKDDFESALNVNLMKAILIRKMQVSANPGLLSKSIVNTIDEYKKEYNEEFDSEVSDNKLLIKADSDIRKAIGNSSIANLVYKFESNYFETPKNKMAVDIALKLVSEGKKVIIWDVFVQNMYAIKNLITNSSDLQVEIINGLVNGDDRQNAISRFKTGNSMILIANPATLAESISLHKVCQNAIYVNRNFNAAQFIQSKERIHRISMPKGLTATYYFLINKETVDEAVNDRLKIKEDRMLKIFDSDELLIGGEELENTMFMTIEDLAESFKK